MSNLPAVHLCIVQPLGYVHALGFLDQARYFRHQFQRIGAQVTLAKNRLRHDAVNFVFGAHVGFDASLRDRFSCVFVNLEQLGHGGAAVSADYLKLLGGSAVVDYDAANVPSYTTHVDEVPIVTFLHAPYLAEVAPIPLEERPIDLLFFGCLNPRRQALLDRIEAAGVSVSRFDGPLYGPERDSYIRQAKAVFNGHFYETARFEQTRASQCMSLGTPLISERGTATAPPAAYEDSVFWVRESELTEFFQHRFNSPAFHDDARRKLETFAAFDPIEQYADVLAFAAGYRQAHARQIAAGPWQPTQLHIGSGKDYKPGWLNIDILESALPDVVLDLSQPQQWPVTLSGATCGPVLLERGSLGVIYANNVLEHVGDLPQLMTNCLALLKDGGSMLIEVPHERAPTAWQDPTHVRALNERSWIYYTDWFWYLGWFESRFKQEKFEYLDARLQVCAREQGHFMRVVLVKTPTSMAERMTARTMRADFGGIEDDSAFIAEDAASEPVFEAPSQVNSPRVLVKAA